MQREYNRRSFPRRDIGCLLEVDDEHGDAFGRVVDFSLEGLRLLCTATVKRGQSYQLNMMLPRQLVSRGVLSFAATTVWTTPSKVPGHQLCGFRMTEFDQDAHSYLALSSAIADYENFIKQAS